MDKHRDYKVNSKGERTIMNICVPIFSLGDAIVFNFFNSQGQSK
jgi:hypothetical protein